MPIFDYKCKNCNNIGNHLVKQVERDKQKCPKCDSKEYNRQLSSCGVKFVGSGFYQNDYKGR